MFFSPHFSHKISLRPTTLFLFFVWFTGTSDKREGMPKRSTSIWRCLAGPTHQISWKFTLIHSTWPGDKLGSLVWFWFFITISPQEEREQGMWERRWWPYEREKRKGRVPRRAPFRLTVLGWIALDYTNYKTLCSFFPSFLMCPSLLLIDVCTFIFPISLKQNFIKIVEIIEIF